jgi:carbon-monoxide dehydrogenase medium subunit
VAFSDFNRSGADIVDPSFEYYRPASLSEACALLSKLGPEALPLAGGTDVVVDWRRGTKQPRHLVSLTNLEELQQIVVEKGELRIGASVTPARLETSEVVASARPELLDAVGVFGTPQVRNRATVGGNLCSAASCGDLAPLLVALSARVVVVGVQERRELPLEKFFGDHRRTVLQAGEILVEVAVPIRSSGEGAAYRAFGLRAANYITVAGVAACIQLEKGVCRQARIALGAVAPTPVLVPAAAERLVGSPLDEAGISEAARAARAAAAPISDVRGTAEHRRELVEALCVRALRAAEGRAR